MRWEVQPHIHSEVAANRLGKALIERFRGEVWVLPVEIPAAEEEPKD